MALWLPLVFGAELPKRVLAIGYDGLGCADASYLIDSGRATALNRIDQLYCNLSLGMSVTQAGWAATWTGVPALEIAGNLYGAIGNRLYSRVGPSVHLLERIMLDDPNIYVGWISGKGANVRGNTLASPHYGVYKELKEGHAGVYHGDQLLTNQQVYDRAQSALVAAGEGPMIVFALFRSPDSDGHETKSLAAYLDAAVEVDGFAEQLILTAKGQGPTAVAFLSDHAFGFTERSDGETNHTTQDKGMLGFDFPTSGVGHSALIANGSSLFLPVVNQGTFPRLMARLFGYDPDFMSLPGVPSFHYAMHGVSVAY